MKLVGPFSQIITMDGLPNTGALKDEQLHIISDGGLLINNGLVLQTEPFKSLKKEHPSTPVEEVTKGMTAFPGFVDCHTHICFWGSRAGDFAARNNGRNYQEIAAAGGGIWDTVTKTREATQSQLESNTERRLSKLIQRGITTVEIKSGYGLSLEEELKLLRTIKAVASTHQTDVISTCLAAHIIPREFKNETEYLTVILNDLEPVIRKEQLTKRFDIFVEENAFSVNAALPYLMNLRKLGYNLTVHGDQFTTGGSKVAIECGAVSVDHLEASKDDEVKALAKSNTVPVVLPGASIGLGMPFSPARKLLDAGCSLAIASDWNPGSAPNGNLLAQASILSTYEKISAAEVFAGLSFRAAHALNLHDRGILKEGMVADVAAFETVDYREILYQQGELQPSITWKRGKKVEPVNS